MRRLSNGHCVYNVFSGWQRKRDGWIQIDRATVAFSIGLCATPIFIIVIIGVTYRRRIFSSLIWWPLWHIAKMYAVNTQQLYNSTQYEDCFVWLSAAFSAGVVVVVVDVVVVVVVVFLCCFFPGKSFCFPLSYAMNVFHIIFSDSILLLVL